MKKRNLTEFTNIHERMKQAVEVADRGRAHIEGVNFETTDVIKNKIRQIVGTYEVDNIVLWRDSYTGDVIFDFYDYGATGNSKILAKLIINKQGVMASFIARYRLVEDFEEACLINPTQPS